MEKLKKDYVLDPYKPLKGSGPMLVDYNTTLAFRCPICRVLGYYPLSIFSLSRFRDYSISCNCGFPMAIVGVKKKDIYYLKYNCLSCSTDHTFYYSQGKFFSSCITPIPCPLGGMTSGYLGPDAKLRDRIPNDEGLASLLGQLDFHDYFHDPETMLEVLKIILDITETNRLFCQCGSDEMDVTIYPHQLEIICKVCGDVVMIQGGTKDSLISLQRIKNLLLPLGEDNSPDVVF